MQSYHDIPDTTTLTASRSMLLNNILTAMSCSSGTTFPTTNLQVGMLCLRTDQNKLYQLMDTAPTWVVVADLGGQNSIPTVNKPATDLPSTWPYGMSIGVVYNNGYPTMYGSLMSIKGTSSASVVQILIGWSGATAGATPGTWVRNNRDNADQWSPWSVLFAPETDGAGSGLDADLLDGKDSGNASGNIPINNGTVNTNLNADMVDGLHAGNATGQVPVSNGTVNTNLNADLLDGFHSSSFVRTVGGVGPDASGNVQANYVPLAGGTMTGALVSQSYLQTMRNTDPVVEVHKPGVIAGGLMVTSDNRLTLAQTNGSGAWVATRFSVDLSWNGNAYVNGRTVWDSGNIGTPLNAVGGALTRSGNMVSLNPIVTARGLHRITQIAYDAYGRVTATINDNCNCNCSCG